MEELTGEKQSQAHSQTPVHSKPSISRVGGPIHVTHTEMPLLNRNKSQFSERNQLRRRTACNSLQPPHRTLEAKKQTPWHGIKGKHVPNPGGRASGGSRSPRRGPERGRPPARPTSAAATSEQPGPHSRALRSSLERVLQLPTAAGHADKKTPQKP